MKPLKNTFITFILLFISFISISQTTLWDEKQLLYFESGESTLTLKQKDSLNSYITSLKINHERYKFTITGYTDDVGSIESNQQLSTDRATSIKNLLIENGFLEENISSIGKGIDTTSSTEKSINRHVEIRTVLSYDMPTKIGSYEITPEEFQITNNKNSIFRTKNGSKFNIPSNIFETLEGKSVNGKIKIVFTEYRTPFDFILSDIPMSMDNNGQYEHFSSAGMFKIKAYYNDKELRVKKNKSYQLDYKTVPGVNDWDFFNLDETTNKWTKISTQTQHTQFSHRQETKNYCNNNICENILFLAQEGMRYTKKINSVSYRKQSLDVLDSILSKKLELENQTKLLRTKLLPYKNNYSFQNQQSEIKKTKNSKIYIQINGQQNAYDETLPLSEIVFVSDAKKSKQSSEFIKSVLFSDSTIYNANPILFKDLKNGVLKFSKLEDNKLKDYTYPISFNYPAGISKKNRKQYILNSFIQSDSIKNYTQNKVDSLNKLINEKQLLIQKIDYTTSVINDKIYPKARNLTKVKNEKQKLECLWDLNQPYMKTKERSLSFYEWLAYFDDSKGEMRHRFKNIMLSNDYKVCYDQIKKINDNKEIVKKKQKEITKITLSGMGIYNCDVIKKLNSPLAIRPKYDSPNNIENDIAVIYLIDSELNNAIKYNSYLGYSPYNFVYSTTSTNHLIAIDFEGNCFISNNTQFLRITELAKKNQLDNIVIKLSDIPTSATSENLFKNGG